MNIPDDTTLPICYRSDNKYRYFLITSIHSLLKYYKGTRKIVIYICTNDILTLPELLDLQRQYQFDYYIVNINDEYIKKHTKLSKFAKFIFKKYFGYNHYEAETANYNNTTYIFNPFNRSKSIVALWVFFLATTHHKKVLCLDTDTLIVADIAELFDTDITDYYVASCNDWIDTHTFNPSVAVVNTAMFQKEFFRVGVQVAKQLIKQTFTTEVPFCEVMQKIMNDYVGDKWIRLDNTWNTPITHMHLYGTPKIYHFSESWTGNLKVHEAHKIYVNKYL